MERDKNDKQKYNEEFSRHLDYAEYFPNKESDIKKEKESPNRKQKNK